MLNIEINYKNYANKNHSFSKTLNKIFLISMIPYLKLTWST